MNYKEPWIEPSAFDKTTKSILELAEVVVSAAGPLEAHKRILLDRLIWEITQSPGGKYDKYNTRYVSECVYNQGQQLERKVLRHEHVVPRKDLINLMIEKPHQIKRTLAKAIACLVTKDEDHLLRHGAGWERYKSAGIRVYDRLKMKWLEL